MAAQDFIPKLYKFVLPQEFSESALIWNLKDYKAKVPSYSTLLSHTFALVWHLFNMEGAELICIDRADITWALAFLEAIDTTSLGDVSFLDMVSNLLPTKISTEAFFISRTAHQVPSQDSGLALRSQRRERFRNCQHDCH